MSARDQQEQGRVARAAQLEVRARGRGFVALAFKQGNGQKLSEIVLQYPYSGTLVGEPPRDVQNAEKLQAAAEALNDALLELAS